MTSRVRFAPSFSEGSRHPAAQWAAVEIQREDAEERTSPATESGLVSPRISQ